MFTYLAVKNNILLVTIKRKKFYRYNHNQNDLKK